MTSLSAFANLSLHHIGEEGLLLDPANRRLYALNACAAFIWSLLKDGKSPAEVSRALNEQFAVPADAAVSYVANVLRQYETLGQDAKPSGPETAMPMAAAPSGRLILREKIVRRGDMGAQTVELFLDVGLGGDQQGFMIKPLRIDARSSGCRIFRLRPASIYT
jgi:hypothetical protein